MWDESLMNIVFSFFKVVDTGLDETSCFFAEADGSEIEHGHYLDEFAFLSYPHSYGNAAVAFNGGSFPVNMTRRKVRATTKGARNVVFFPFFGGEGGCNGKTQQ